VREKSNDRSLINKLRDAILRLLRKKSPPEADPYAYSMAPCAAARKDEAAQRSPKSRLKKSRMIRIGRFRRAARVRLSIFSSILEANDDAS
jgi:hypothetical protein